MSNRIFQRRVTVQIGQAGEDGRVWTGGRPGELRIAFDIEKSTGQDPNQATVTINNLAHASRTFIAEGQTLIVEAGYEDGVDLIWRGEITDVTHRQEGPDWVTQIESLDGKGLLDQPVNLSFGEGASAGQMAMGLIDRFKEQGTTGFISETLEGGASAITGLLSGGTMQTELDRLTKSAGLEYSIQDGALVIPDPDGGTDEEVVILRPDSGLVGSPERGSDGLTATSKLNGKLKPHRRFVVESRHVQGAFVARRVSHFGDTHGQDWDTEVEA